MEDTESLLAARSDERRLNGHCDRSDPTQGFESKLVEDFRRRLKYFFMNPCQKYRARGRKPWKLMLQILKIAIITVQVASTELLIPSNMNAYRASLSICVFFPFKLVSFGLSNEMMVTFKDENLMTFRHLFLKGYKDQWSGSYSLYTKTDMYDHVYYIVSRVLAVFIILQHLNIMSYWDVMTILELYTMLKGFFFSPSTSISKT